MNQSARAFPAIERHSCNFLSHWAFPLTPANTTCFMQFAATPVDRGNFVHNGGGEKTILEHSPTCF